MAAGGDPGDGALRVEGPVGAFDPGLKVLRGHLEVIGDEAGEVHGV